jgi:predicted secreted Zn-dependent protease
MKRIWLFTWLSLFACAQAKAQILVEEKTTYYEIEAATNDEFLEKWEKSYKRRGFITFATTSRNMVIDFDTNEENGRCYATNIRGSIEIEYTYPKWIGVENASPAVRKAWDDLLAYSIEHENRHGELIKQFGRDAEAALREYSVPVESSCIGFEEKGNAVIERVLAKMEDKQRSMEAWSLTPTGKFARLLKRFRKAE